MRDPLLFSYATRDDPALRRLAIRTIERVTGQPRLERLYLANQRNPRRGESFWDAAIRHLALLFHEVRNKMGQAVVVRIGAPLGYETLRAIRDRHALIDHLRRTTYALAADSDDPAAPPRRIIRLRRRPRQRLRAA